MTDSTQELTGLTFDDVFIRPARASVEPAKVNLGTNLLPGFQFSLPMIPSPMLGVFSENLASQLATLGIPCPVPRNFAEEYAHRGRFSPEIPTVLSVSPFDPIAVQNLLRSPGTDFLMLDTVTAHHDKVFELLDSLSPEFYEKIIVGNIATREAARDFASYGLAAVKVGLGPGSICTTTQITGVGIPQLQAISEVVGELAGGKTKIIADGGVRSAGDVAKALAAGAHAVMMGKMFAATTESGGDVVVLDGVSYKKYEGCEYPSIEFNPDSINPALEAEIVRLKETGCHRSEGVSGLLRHSGSVALLIEYMRRSLSASFAFVGAENLERFQELARFQQVSQSARKQACAHSVNKVTKKDIIFG